MSKKLQIPVAHISFFPLCIIKGLFASLRILSNPHQLSSTSQVSAAAVKKKHVPIALPRQHKGMFDWAAASVRRRWNSTAGRNLRSCCTLHPRLLFPSLSLSLSLVIPSSLHHIIAAHSSSPTVHGSDVHHVKSDCIIPADPAAISLRLQSQSLSVCLLLNRDTCQEAISSKTPQADF